jgi:ferredoxin
MLMLYFSGTGNSKYIAERFAQAMNGACHSIEEAIDFDGLFASHDTLGFCYPIYCSRVPRILRDFVIQHQASVLTKKLIIFCTQMGFSGDGARAFTDIIPIKTSQVIYAEHFTMPNNVPNLWVTPLASEKTVQKYISKAHKKIEKIAEDIKNGVVKRRGFNIGSRILGLPQGLMFPAIERKYKSGVRIGEGCTGCGVCVKICPMDNFAVDNGKVIGKGNCTLCYRCTNACPSMCVTVMTHARVSKQYKGV